MTLQVASLNSGSNGNCYYIGNGQEAVLVDAGISCRETERRMMRMGLSMKKVKGIFISHEHTDHIKGTEVLSRKHDIPVFITEKTYRYSRLNLSPSLIRHFRSHEPVNVGELTVTPFPKRHDAADPHSFNVTGNSRTVGVMTDLGTGCTNLTEYFNRCDAAFLESNYDEWMLDHGGYPLYLKRRIRGDEGHLSNNQALEVYLGHRSANLQLLILSHLSAENNHPKVVDDLFSAHAKGATIAVASRFEESAVYTLS